MTASLAFPGWKGYVPAGPQTKTLFIFSDSVIGKTKDSKVKRRFQDDPQPGGIAGKKHPGESFQFLLITEEKHRRPTSLFVPQTPNTRPGEYYWLGDGFVNTDADSTLYIFLPRAGCPHRFIFEFEQTGVSIIAIPPGSKTALSGSSAKWIRPLCLPAGRFGKVNFRQWDLCKYCLCRRARPRRLDTFTALQV